MVPGTGLEPAHLTAWASKTHVSTNFTTRAYECTARTRVRAYKKLLLLGDQFSVIGNADEVSEFLLTVHFNANQPAIVHRIIVE